MVTIKELLKRPWMSQFTANAKADNESNMLSRTIRNNSCPINVAFTWAFTPQGHEYWARISNSDENEF